MQYAGESSRFSDRFYFYVPVWVHSWAPIKWTYTGGAPTRGSVFVCWSHPMIFSEMFLLEGVTSPFTYNPLWQSDAFLLHAGVSVTFIFICMCELWGFRNINVSVSDGYLDGYYMYYICFSWLSANQTVAHLTVLLWWWCLSWSP